jgi:Protein of unknown function (DUF2442)
MVLRIDKAKVCAPFTLDLTFNDGTKKRVNVKRLLKGPIFQPLKVEDYFRTMKLDAVCGTVCWRNGADFAPESLYRLKPVPPAKESPIEKKPGEKRRRKSA